MKSQNIRFVLIAIIVFVGMLLYNAWQKEQVAPHLAHSDSTHLEQAQQARLKEQAAIDKDIPALINPINPTETPGAAESKNIEAQEKISAHSGREIQVRTDVLNLKIDSLGGDITQLILSDYAENQESFGQGYVLLDNTDTRYYIAQSGLTGSQGPDKRGVGRAKYETPHLEYNLQEGQEELIVDLKTRTAEGVDIIKRFIFSRGSYVINLEYLIYNKTQANYKGSFYARLKRKSEKESGGGFLGVQTFTGAAIHTADTPYKKISFKDIADKPLEQSVHGGWAAMVEHYFVSAWIPAHDITSTYQTQALGADIYSVGLIEPAVTVAPGEEKSLKMQLYAGPEITKDLEKLAPGLNLAVDYGMLWPICQPIFWLLDKLHHYTGNWGVAIILTTILIKLLFYKLSASSYRSMGNMRRLQPRLEALKERCGDDKQKFSQAVMELYKKEKINPLGGCLPILIQIPVFIALYYVLLGSVELREAPFFGWISDLSDKDPYYILPILMGLSMVVQQKLNPAPADPVQAKVMMFMPVIFTVLFLNFPSGLVLYWFVNNMLSIAQQWFITRNVERGSKAAT